MPAPLSSYFQFNTHYIMKLHLPTRLRAALMACFAVVTSLTTTLATGAFVGGAFAVTVVALAAPQASGLSVTGTAGTEITSLSTTNVTGYKEGFTTFKYAVSSGIGTISGMSIDGGSVIYTFDLDLDAAAGAGDAALVYVSNGSTQWGLHLYDGAYTEGGIAHEQDGQAVSSFRKGVDRR